MRSISGIETARGPDDLVMLSTVRASTRMSLTTQVQMSCLCNRDEWNGSAGNSSWVEKVLFVIKNNNFESYDTCYFVFHINIAVVF